MKQLSFLDLHYLLEEFKVLEENRIDSFYFEEGVFYLKVYVSKLGSRYLVNKVSQFIYLDDKKVDTSHPNPFIAYLRKYLKNTYIKKISQIEGERILCIDIEKKQEEKIISYKLYLELFAQGNVVLCNEKGDIINALTKRTFRDRSMKVKSHYELPPKKERSLGSLDEKDFKDALKESDLFIVKFLALKFGLGGKYAEEILSRVNIEKNTPTQELKDKEIKTLLQELKTLYEKKIDAQLLISEEQIKDFFPYPFTSIKEKTQSVQSFNEAVKAYFSQFLKEEDLREKEFHKELKKLEKRVGLLKAQRDDIDREYEENRTKGELIYEHYADLDSLLNNLNKLGREKGWEEVKKRIEEDPKAKKMILQLNEKNNEIILELASKITQ